MTDEQIRQILIRRKRMTRNLYRCIAWSLISIAYASLGLAMVIAAAAIK